MKIATSEQMRGLDRSAIRERGIPSLQLMDRAAAAVVERCLERMAGKEKKGWPFSAAPVTTAATV